jgi:antitoxin ParD1/3/4
MSSRTLTLSDEQEQFVQQESQREGFESTTDYLLDLIDRERDRKQMRDMILDGIRSGRPVEIDTTGYLDLGKILDEEAKKWESGGLPQ